MTAPTSSHRTKFEGLCKIVQFNWPFYVVGLSLTVIGMAILILLFQLFPPPLAWLGLGALVPGCWWLFASLVASHWIYDRADLYDFEWLDLKSPRTATILTAGFDEAEPGLLRKWPDTDWTCFDFYDEKSMSEPSIRRAQKRYPLSNNWKYCSAHQWPCEDQSFELIVFSFSAHELRTSNERVTLLREAKRALDEGGTILVVEHLRDLPNAIVFGPGVFHFHSEKTWREDFRRADLNVSKAKRLAGFVKAFYLTR